MTQYQLIINCVYVIVVLNNTQKNNRRSVRIPLRRTEATLALREMLTTVPYPTLPLNPPSLCNIVLPSKKSSVSGFRRKMVKLSTCWRCPTRSIRPSGKRNQICWMHRIWLSSLNFRAGIVQIRPTKLTFNRNMLIHYKCMCVHIREYDFWWMYDMEFVISMAMYVLYQTSEPQKLRGVHRSLAWYSI